jgi:CheY-like chemotaxis protein
VNTLITEFSELIRQSATRNVVVEFALMEDPWAVHIDPNQLEIALLNLVINARDAMPKGGAVTIETAKLTPRTAAGPVPLPVPGNEFVQITIRDTGVGMPRDVAARAGEPFFTTKGIGKGTGLGLYQVVDFAKQAGGHVKIDSEPGIGTAVTISLPRLMAEDVADTPPSQPKDVSRFAGRGEKILMVENEPDILVYTAEGLEALGYRVLPAQDASSALTILETTPNIDLLFTDLGLPGIDGLQLAREATRRWPQLPILYTSGSPEKASPGDGAAGHGTDYIVKPYELEKLAQTIRAVLDSRLTVRASEPA